MVIDKYENLVGINIRKVDIIFGGGVSKLSEFCIAHNIFTLKDFFDICELNNNEYDLESGVLLNSICNLLKFKYLGEVNDSVVRILNHNFIKLNGEGSLKYREFNYELCYALGFTFYEARLFVQLCKESNQDKKIGEFINDYKDLTELKAVSPNFKNKLELLDKYYNKVISKKACL